MKTAAPEPCRYGCSLGHVALHYNRPEEGMLASRLLKLLGFIETQDLALPGGHFYRFVVSPRHQERGDGIIFLSAVPNAQRQLAEAIRTALKLGTSEEHPAVAGMRAALLSDPECSFHIGVLLESLQELEQIVLRLQREIKTDPELRGRVRITLNRARRGDADVDATLDASPVFGRVGRYAYGRNGVQVFVETDILVSGILNEGLVVELDYVFPDQSNHILSVAEI